MKKIKYSLGGENILPEITATAKRIIKKPEATQPPTKVYNTTRKAIRYTVDGKTNWSTEDKLEELFKDDYQTYKNNSPSVRKKLIDEKYKIEYRGDVDVPTDETQTIINNNVSKKPKYFLGAILGLAGQAVNMIGQNNAQKKQIAEQNRLIEKQNLNQLEQRIDVEEVSQRNFGSNTPMHSFYANGGNIENTASDLSIAKGAKHEQGGVDYKNVEVEGGEVIKHEGSNDFIFSDRLMVDDKNTYGDVAKQFAEGKGKIEKKIGALLKTNDKLNKDLTKVGSTVAASTINRRLQLNNSRIEKLKSIDKSIEMSVEQLKQHQLQKGMELGLYNEDGTPKDTDGKFKDGGSTSKGTFINGKWVASSNNYNPEMLQNPIQGLTTKYADFKDYTKSKDVAIKTNSIKTPTKVNINVTNPTSTTSPNFISKVGNFLGSNKGQAVTGLVGAGLNITSNLITAKNMSKLKTPTYIPIKAQDSQLINMSATRQSIEDSANEQNKYAEENFANPQVAAAMKAKIETDKIKKLGEVNQQEQNANVQIRDNNIARRLQVEQTNQQGVLQTEQQQYQKSASDINNYSQVVSAGVSDLNKVSTQYRQGVMEERAIDMYGKSFAGSVSDELVAAMKDGVDLQKVRNMTSEEAVKYLSDKGIGADKITKWSQYSKKA